jgi:signal transduction histidine kinase/CheY-like chemotaxis protein/ligand-binding sensor domain-containing protein/AraC-like DNA-binding protein
MNKFAVFILLIFGFQQLFAQQLRFDRFDISNGLSQNNIHCMEFDDIGNLWIGTLDGLNRYNGYQFEIFKPGRNLRGNLASNHITALGKGIDGDMWIVTRGGDLNFYRANTHCFEKINTEDFGQFNIAAVSHIQQTNDSMLWLSSPSLLGLWMPKKEKFINYQPTKPISGIKAIDRQGLIIFGQFGIEKIKVDSSYNEIESVSVLNEPCYGLEINHQGYYALLQSGIAILNKGFEIQSYAVAFSLSFGNHPNLNNINAFAVSDQAFWLGGYGFLGRYAKADGKYVLQTFKHDPLNSNSYKGYNVTRLKVDRIGNLWIGTMKNGLNHFNSVKNQFQHYGWDLQTLSDPDSDPVRAICKTRNKELWLGFDRNGLGLLLPNGKQHFFSHYFKRNNEQSPIRDVRVIFEDSQGTIWIGEAENLCYYNRDRNRVETIDSKYSFAWPYRSYSIKEMELSKLTITSSSFIGFVNLSDGTLTTISISSTPGIVRDILQDKYRNLWLTKDSNGLLKIKYPNRGIKQITSNSHKLSDNKAYCLLVTGDSLWVGTNSGLNLIDLKTDSIVAQYFEEDGLCNNIVYSIYKDEKGNLWMSTNKGISHFNVKAKKFSTYLSNDFFMDDAHFSEANGTLYYGGYTGVVSFHPHNISQQRLPIVPLIENFSIFNRPVYAGDTIDGRVIFTQALPTIKTIKLLHTQNTFTIGFNAYPFDFPNPNRFRYRLKGFQEHWTETSTIRSVSYTKVPPGTYVFEVQAASDQMLFSNAATLEIVIVPPFWMTFWFKIMVAACVLALTLLFFSLRVKQIKKRNQWLKLKVDEQTAALREQNQTIIEMSEKLHQADESKLRFFTNISHEFRTPLTLILGHLENLNTHSRSAVKSIQNNAVRLLRLIDQVIDLRKIDQDLMKLVVSPFDFVAFTKEVVDSLDIMARQKEIKLDFQSNVSFLEVWLDVEKTEKIIYNLLSNAIKFTHAGKKISIAINLSNQHYSLHIADEGIGISEAELERVFDRFYRSDDTQAVFGGYGIGLSMVKGLSELQHGKIEVVSKVGQGSCFTLTFPTGKEHYDETDFGKAPAQLKLYEDEQIEMPEFVEKLSGKKILIVEDNPELLGFLSGLLNKHFKIDTATNGRAALGMLETAVPDLIISDIMMPEMDGMEFCRRVKTNVETSHIPFILLTAKTDAETQIDGFELGVDDYIEKPFQSRVLFSRIQALLLNREKLREQFYNSARQIPVVQNLASRDQEFLKQVDEVIHAHFGNPNFSIDILSEQLNMSRATFYRKFTDLTGSGPADYLRKVRLRKAYEMLITDKLSIVEVCENIGFQSVSHFRKSFKSEFGKTPSEIQKY